jgi:hypothetical protein
MIYVKQLCSFAIAAALAACRPQLPSESEARIEDRLYEPGRDPRIGVHLVSWNDFGARGRAVWTGAVDDVYAHGIRSVTFDLVRFVDPATGAIRQSDGRTAGPALADVTAAMERAGELGIEIAVVPFVEPDGFAFWRAQLRLDGATRARFFADYRAYLREVAEAAQAVGAARLAIGTELRGVVGDRENAAELVALIDEVAAVYGGAIGYAANWDDYRDATLDEVVWRHPRVSELGVDAYFPLASCAEADASGGFPNVPLVEAVRRKMAGELDALIAFADGKRVVLSEHGLTPFNRTLVAPSSVRDGEIDTDEVRNGYAGVLAALQGRGDRIAAIALWHWAMEGAEGSAWVQHPDAVDAPGTAFDERLGRVGGEYVARVASRTMTVLGR